LVSNITYADEKVEEVREYTYLGITLLRNLSNKRHLEERRLKASVATSLCGELGRMSLMGLRYIFNVKVRSVITYGMASYADTLNVEDLKRIESMKWRYYKRALGVPQSVSNTMMREAMGERIFVEELGEKVIFNKDVLSDFRKYIEERGWSFVEARYTDGPVFKQENWETSGNRSMLLNVNAHGYHYLLCINGCWEAGDSCMCKLCGEKCDNRYHILECKGKLHSIRETLRALR
jgi:hypothetical protein